MSEDSIPDYTSVKDLGQLLGLLEGRDDVVRHLHRRLEEQVAEIENLQAVVNERDQALGNLQIVLNSRDETVSSLQNRLNEQTKTIFCLQAAAGDQDETVRDLQAALGERDQTVSNLQSAMAQKDATFSDLQAVLGGKDATVNDLEGSQKESGEINSQLRALLVEHDKTVVEFKVLLGARDRNVIRLQVASDRSDETISHLQDALEKKGDKITRLQSLLEAKDKDGESPEETISHLTAMNLVLEEKCERYKRAYVRLGEINSNYRCYDTTTPVSDEEKERLKTASDEMIEYLEASPEIYRMSKFWVQFFQYNMRQLNEVGLNNFKLTINQNYQNYIPADLDDPKLTALKDWFLNNPSLRPFLSAIENPDGLTDDGYLSEPGTSIFSDDPTKIALYRSMVTLGWEYCLQNDSLDLCARLEEPELGNPIRVHYDGKLISQDLATSAIEIMQMFRPTLEYLDGKPINVLEVGGGYGRLAHAVLSTLLVGKYIIVDVTPAIFVSQWYLENLFPAKKVWQFRPFTAWEEVEEEIKKADVIFLAPAQLELLPDNFVNLSVAISTLHEMRLEQANNYLREMARVSSQNVALKNYWSYENPYDGIVIRHEEYKYPDTLHQTVLENDPLNPVFFVEVFEQKDRPPDGALNCE